MKNSEQLIRPKMILTGRGPCTGYNRSVVTAFFREFGIAEPLYEMEFYSGRKWRWDIAWIVPVRLAIEVQGGLFTGGAHIRGASLLREHEKLNAGAADGWRILFVTPSSLCMTETAELVKKCFMGNRIDAWSDPNDQAQARANP